MSAPTKVLRVVRGFVPTQLDPEDLQGLDPKEQAVLNQARERLRSCIRRYLGDPDVAAPMPKKIFRVATHRHLQAVDSALTVVTGCGLESILFNTQLFNRRLSTLRMSLCRAFGALPFLSA